MIHFLPDSSAVTETGAPYAEALTRLASVRQALRLVEMMEGKPARPAATIEFEQTLPPLSAPARRCLEARSACSAASAAAGIELILSGDANPAAVDVLADDIRSGLEDIERLFAGRA
jgi:hypothetical protein